MKNRCKIHDVYDACSTATAEGRTFSELSLQFNFLVSFWIQASPVKQNKQTSVVSLTFHLDIYHKYIILHETFNTSDIRYMI